MTHEQLETYESQLKPCPFCGEKVKLYVSVNGKGYNASCSNTECRILIITETSDSPEEAIKVWNTRSAESKVLEDIRAEIAEIEDGISSYHNDRPWIYKDEALAVIAKHIGGKDK